MLPKRLIARFWSKVNKDGPRKVHMNSCCWVWTASTTTAGYGQLGRRIGETNMLAHRVSYELAYGSFPSSAWVLHRCDTPSCVRPTHLLLGDAKDNRADQLARRRRKGFTVK